MPGVGLGRCFGVPGLRIEGVNELGFRVARI